MRPLTLCLLAAALAMTSGHAAAQEPNELNAKLGAFDPQCLDLYDALEACATLEPEEAACDDLTEQDIPFNQVQAALADWPERYGPKSRWMGYCQAACKGKGAVGIVEFADKVCHTTLSKRAD